MSSSTIDQISKIFAPVATAIGQGAQYGWEVVMRQQLVVAVGDLVQTLACLCMIILMIWCCVVSEDKGWASESDGGCYILFGFVCGIAGIFFFVGLYGAISHLINPAYYALQFFIDLGKNQ